MFIEHVYDFRTKTFLAFNDFKAFFGIESKDFLKYHKLINSIPLKWKNKLKSESIIGNNNQKYFIDEVLTNKSKNNILYLKQIQNICNTVVIQPNKKWEEFQDINWKKHIEQF